MQCVAAGVAGLLQVGGGVSTGLSKECGVQRVECIAREPDHTIAGKLECHGVSSCVTVVWKRKGCRKLTTPALLEKVFEPLFVDHPNAQGARFLQFTTGIG